ncbi:MULTISPECIES: alpha/beta fold hydrolase [Pseudonocardia]|uniref:Alpha/beta hydrolase n=2 Tax=Pseudonocardia TaxID=1847 RepID=A0ABQ0S442_9PSEU|nr:MULTISPECIES: alpha/beta hydrolase [Pseudonocardia]OSY36973.1 putative non-heme bromoperoxidase BpoC [Pseudonocardia autotrophica]TDN75656.1 pimeloyl-ACP methyl ester carboxylesterase [Pseudonocardia autotrophica]BBF99628.1 alpha/beta hydrolase [Pseudonocardia autotrophica]GEC27690.1 alpha/beta hydrolase [Pseudonocardia saturnea]
MAAIAPLPDTDVADTGHGPPVLLSHGTLLDRTMFLPQTEVLSEDHRTVAWTSRAGTTRYGTERSLDDLVDDTLAVADTAGIDRFVLAGMSVGGFMAVELALRYPERVAGLVLMATRSAAYTDRERREFGALLEPLDIDGPIPESVIDAFRSVIFGERALTDRPELIERWTTAWRARPARSLYGEYRSWIDKPDRTADLARITVPALVLHGEDDRGIDLEHARVMHAHLPDSTYVPIPGAGHLLAEEQPEAVTAALSDWLRAVRPGEEPA